MTPQAGILRAKVMIATYGPTLVIGLALLGLVSLGSAGWIYTHPPTTEVTDRIDKVPVRSELHTRARVTGESSLYSKGATLRDQPVYFTSATPTVLLSLRTTIPADEPATVNQSLELLIRGIRDGRVFWSETRILNVERATTRNNTITTLAPIDVRNVQNRVGEVTDEIGSAGSVEVLVRTNVTYETPRYSGHESELALVQLADRSYEIEHAAFGRTHSTPVARTVTVPRQSRFGYRLPATVGGVALIVSGLVGLLYTRREDVEPLDYWLQKERYDEWVSAGKLPVHMGDSTVPLSSLEDVVDVAIDTNKRVIYDETQDRYAVIDGNTVYDYTVDNDGEVNESPPPTE